jgi:hypothetical protein
MMQHRLSPLSLLIAFAAAACTDAVEPTQAPQSVALTGSPQAAAAPGPLVPLTLGSQPTAIWPYTDSDLDGTPSDPINLIFIGEHDPRNIRSALMSLDGSRAGPFAAFTCTWTDAIGGNQGAFTSESGWTGSVIQLECGAYVPFRFHVRLFPAAGYTVANAHADVIIPGTEQHQVLTWEIAEQLVVYDLGRSGLLTAAPAQTGVIGAAPTFREIPPIIYNGLPVELRAMTGGPLFGSVATGVGIATDGSATILSVGAAPPAGGTSQRIDLTFGQVIPKPLCNSGNEFIRVDGPVVLEQEVRVEGDVLRSRTTAEAQLSVRNVNLATGALGEPAEARVHDRSSTFVQQHAHLVQNHRRQQLWSGDAPEQLFQELRIGSGGPARYATSERCR